MFSIPPATTISASPAIIACAPCITAFIPEAHTLLTVVHGTLSGKPANLAACRAGAWPTPAWITLPIKTSFTKLGSKFILFNAPLIAAAPNWVAVTVDNEPIKLPIGVLTAETMTTFLFIICCRFILFHFVPYSSPVARV